MRLNELLDNVNDNRVQVGGICIDSRKITPGDLFVALRGTNFDGHDFVDEALRRGAAAVCAERQIAGSFDIPIVVEPSLPLK